MLYYVFAKFVQYLQCNQAYLFYFADVPTIKTNVVL